MKVEDLKFDKRNYRKHDDKNRELIKKSINEVGFGRSIVIDNENEIVCGNGVVSQIAKSTPIKVVETNGSELIVVKRTDLQTDDAKRKQLAVMDNSTSDSSEFDFELLQEDFDTEELEDWGLDIDFAIEEEEKEVVEDEVPEEVETRCKLGDIWQLGEHRLMCGDSTKVDDVEKLMNGNKADMVFTDPPYGVDVVGVGGSIGGDTIYGKVGKYSKVIGDDKEFDPSPILKWFEKSKIFLWGANYYANKLFNSGKWIVWDKNRGEGTTFSDCELCWTNLDGIAVKKYKCTWDGMRREGESGKRVHPTQKPIKLCANILNDYSEKGETIIDLFGGSGSTLIACEQLNRKCYTMELDEHYCDVILQRYINFKGSDADVFLLKDGNKIPYSEAHS